MRPLGALAEKVKPMSIADFAKVAGAEGKGSARSVTGVDLGAAIARLARDGLIGRGGGHRMAAGLSLAPDQLEPAMARLGELLAAQGAGERPPRSLRLDGLLAAGGATPELAAALAAAGPYGAGAPAPRLALAGAASPAPGGSATATWRCASPTASAATSTRWPSAPSRPRSASFLEAQAGAAAHLAGRLERDDWAGRARAKLTVEDAAPARLMPRCTSGLIPGSADDT